MKHQLITLVITSSLITACVEAPVAEMGSPEVTSDEAALLPLLLLAGGAISADAAAALGAAIVVVAGASIAVNQTQRNRAMSMSQGELWNWAKSQGMNDVQADAVVVKFGPPPRCTPDEHRRLNDQKYRDCSHVPSTYEDMKRLRCGQGSFAQDLQDARLNMRRCLQTLQNNANKCGDNYGQGNDMRRVHCAEYDTMMDRMSWYDGFCNSHSYTGPAPFWTALGARPGRPGYCGPGYQGR